MIRRLWQAFVGHPFRSLLVLLVLGALYPARWLVGLWRETDTLAKSGVAGGAVEPLLPDALNARIPEEWRPRRIVAAEHVEGEFADNPAIHTSIAGTRSLAELKVQKSRLGEWELESLGVLESLRSLTIMHCPGDQTCRQVGQAVSLRELKLAGTFSDRGLAHLGRLRNLEELYLQSADVTDAGLLALAGLKRLKKLSISRAAIRGPGLRQLKSLPALESLSLNLTTDDGHFTAIGELTQLKTLECIDVHLTDAALADIGRLPELAELTLWITSDETTNRGFVSISRLRKLNTVGLTTWRGESARGMKHLLTLRPDIAEVSHGGFTEPSIVGRLGFIR